MLTIYMNFRFLLVVNVNLFMIMLLVEIIQNENIPE